MSDKEFERRIGKIIYAARQVFGLSQIELARRLKVPQSKVSRWEKAVVSPSAFEWFDLCRILGISTDTLLWAQREVERPLSRFGTIARTPEEARFRGLDLSESDLGGLSLMCGDFTHSILTNCDLSDAYLPFARFHEADLSGADLSRAILSSADFRGFEQDTDLRGALLTDADMRGALINERTLLPFSNKIASARGLIIVEPSIEEIIVQTARDLDRHAIIYDLKKEANDPDPDYLEELEDAAELDLGSNIAPLQPQSATG